MQRGWRINKARRTNEGLTKAIKKKYYCSPTGRENNDLSGGLGSEAQKQSETKRVSESRGLLSFSVARGNQFIGIGPSGLGPPNSKCEDIQ